MKCSFVSNVVIDGDFLSPGRAQTVCEAHGFSFPVGAYMIDGLMCPIGLHEELVELRHRVEAMERRA